MNSRKIILIVVAMVVAFGAAFGANILIRGAAADAAKANAAPVADGPSILVAVRTLTPGTIIREDAFRYQPWPAELVREAYYAKGEADITKLAGTVVRYPITAGQPVTRGALVSPGDRGFLAAALAPGMRAVTVPVSVEQGVSGFVFPGDRVDVILTHGYSVKMRNGSEDLKASETIIRNVRVLATDQNMVQHKGDEAVTVFRNVTLEATPKIAERIAVARQMGELSLSLRPLAESAAELEAAIAAGEIVLPKNDPKAEAEALRSLAERPSAVKSSMTTSKDISVGAAIQASSNRAIMAANAAAESRAARQEGAGPAPAAAPAQRAPTNSTQNPNEPLISGDIVRVTRGSSVTVVPVGSN